MCKYINSVSLIFIILLSTSLGVNAQWQIVKQLNPKPIKTINVDVPPSIEKRPPIILSMSFVDDLNGWAACDDGTLLITSDGGKNWKNQVVYPKVNTSLAMFFNSIGIFFNDDRNGWIVAEYKNSPAILNTNDGGKSWKFNYRPNFKSFSFHNIWFADKKNGWAVGEYEDVYEDERESGGFILGTQDGGINWKVQYKGNDQESFLHELRFFDQLNGWAVGDNTILHTSDGGKKWERQIVSKDDYFFGVDVISDKEVWVVGSSGVILHTIDGGKNWNQSKLPKEYEDHWLNSVKFTDSNRGWIVGNDGAIFSTDNNGKTWQLESKDKSSYLRGLSVAGNFIFAFGNDGIVLRRKITQN